MRLLSLQTALAAAATPLGQYWPASFCSAHLRALHSLQHGQLCVCVCVRACAERHCTLLSLSHCSSLDAPDAALPRASDTEAAVASRNLHRLCCS